MCVSEKPIRKHVMQERPIIPFRPWDHVDFKFLFVPESGFIAFIVMICTIALGAVLLLRIRRRKK